MKGAGIDTGEEPAWAVSIDDLRAYSDLFDNPLSFLHFVEQGVKAAKSPTIRLEDELDHLGMYLKHNHYTTYAEELRAGEDVRMTFHSYRDDIDRFFSMRMRDSSAPCILRQKASHRFVEIIDLLAADNRPGRSRIAASLLDGDEEWRGNIVKWIADEMVQQPSLRRSRPISIQNRVAGVQVIYCWSPHAVRDEEVAWRHAQSVLLLQKAQQGFLLELTYDRSAKLQAVNWRWMNRADISEEIVAQLAGDVERLRLARLRLAARDADIGPNSQCPCGSGKKYKRCCSTF